jgi:predicted Zn-dependent protease
MKKISKKQLILVSVSVLILAVCIGVTGVLLFSNYRNVALLKQAKINFQRGDEASLKTAEAQLLQLLANDDDNEAAYIMLGAIAGKRKIYPKQAYYCFMAYKLNPLNRENKINYLNALLFAREFGKLENFLSQQHDLQKEYGHYLFYAAGRNGNISKYSKLENDKKPLTELAVLFFKDQKLSAEKKLEAVEKLTDSDPFFRQEQLAIRSDFYLKQGKIKQVEEILLEAYNANAYAFAPILGRFYINFHSLGKGLPIFETYLATYHDPEVAMECAEIYCLLKQPEKILKLREEYQADQGNAAMLCCFYMDALTALMENDFSKLKEAAEPLRKNVTTPLATYIFLCVDIQNGDLAAVRQSYNAMITHRPYLELQKRADNMVANLLRQKWNAAAAGDENFIAIAQLLYRRLPDAFTAKTIIFTQKSRNAVDGTLLADALKRFPEDQGIVKFAIEYYLPLDPATTEKLIAAYRRDFPDRAADMLRYEIIMAVKNKDFALASKLFMANFSPEIAPEYWSFAYSTMREADLQFLSKDKLYAPFCQALLYLKQGKKAEACNILEKADAAGNPELLFFAARILGENDRIDGALQKYAQIPANSPYNIAVLLNTAELRAAKGDLAMSLTLAEKAYQIAPQLGETQFCLADKLHRTGNLTRITDVIKLNADTPWRKKLEPLWISGMQQRIKDTHRQKQWERVRELCRQLLVISPQDPVAMEYLKQLDKMPQ